MKFIVRLERDHPAMLSTLRLWLVFLACAVVAAALVAGLQQAELALSRPPGVPTASAAALAVSARFVSPPPTAFAPTFDDAAASLRAGRFAEAYGRFVALADEGNVDAGRIALVMHRFGPELFGSAWDASVEQLAAWTQWSEAAAQMELARLVARAPDAGSRRLTPAHAGSMIAAFTIVLSSRRTGYVLDGMSWVMKTTHTSSTGSTQNAVDAIPPHENSPGDAVTP
jgi:hypothetical protein